MDVREIEFRYSERFVPILKHLNASLLVSTYAAGKVVSIGWQDDQIRLEFTNFKQAMGLASSGGRLAVGGKDGIHLLDSAGSLTPQLPPVGELSAAYVMRQTLHTGNIQIHELVFAEDGRLWGVNTLFSCLCTFDDRYHFVPRWKPPFLTESKLGDQCHLNGLAMDAGRPAFVTALGTSDVPRGWRDRKSDGGVVVDVANGRVIADGFCMPHSPRVDPLDANVLWVLDSGRGTLVRMRRDGRERRVVANYPGYGRGLALTKQFAFVGMSRGRERSVFGGVPILESGDPLRCGIVVIDRQDGRSLAYLEFESGVEELFDVQLHVGNRVGLRGASVGVDGHDPVWVIPPGEAESLGPGDAMDRYGVVRGGTG